MNLPAITGWGASRDFPRPAVQTFRERWASRQLPRKNNDLTVEVEPGSPTEQEAAKDQGDQRSESVTDRFEAELTALSGVFVPCNHQDLADKVFNVLREKRIDKLLAWDPEHLPPSLFSALKAKDIQLVFDGDPGAKAGLTGVNAAIAETGTIVLTSGPGRPAATSLLPEIHLAILQEADIYENLPQVLHLREIREASSTTLISGPSRTADIEMTLTIGVHGPEEIYVFCLVD
jgi:L-lactate dehydrogenase complex protein LldG